MLRALPWPRPASSLLGLSLLACLALAGCGTPPELRDPPAPLPSGASPPSTASTAPAVAGTGSPTAATALSPSVPVGAAVACAGRPGGAQVVALLRARRVLPAGVRASVTTGPLCAEDWQLTVIQVPNRDPLQVVTEGAPAGLTLVTAGTDVCTVPVRAGAPAGIRTLACDGGALPSAG